MISEAAEGRDANLVQETWREENLEDSVEEGGHRWIGAGGQGNKQEEFWRTNSGDTTWEEPRH